MTKSDKNNNAFSSATFELSSSTLEHSNNRPANVNAPTNSPTKPSGAKIALISSDNPNIELFLFRIFPLFGWQQEQVSYVSSNTWFKELYSQFDVVVETADDINEVSNCSSIVKSDELLALCLSKVDVSNNLIQFLTVDENASQAFADQWFTNLSRPYLGLSWDVRTDSIFENNSKNDDSSEALITLLQSLQNFTGTLVIVQNHLNTDELALISDYTKIPAIDCSDLNDNPQQMMAMLNLLDEFIGVPDFAQNLRSSLNKSCKVLWPKNLLNDGIWTDIRHTFYQSYEIYPQTEAGWREAASQIVKDIGFLKDSSTGIENISSQADVPGSECQDVEALIRYASGMMCEQISEQTKIHISRMIDMFNVARNRANSLLNIFVYHTNMGTAGQLQYKDVGLDLSKYNYEFVVQTFIAAVNRWRPDANIYIATNCDSSLFTFSGNNVKVIGLDVDATTPMFERVNAMCAYVFSQAFDADTLFLDSDAFLNAKFEDILNGDYDVAITTRPNQGLMPVNEGVIVAKVDRKEQVQTFFSRYVGTYEKLIDDETVKSYYGDIRKWRGGQLTLNAITRQASPFTPYRNINIQGVSVRALPCDPFNYSWDYGQSVNVNELKEKYVIHVKGGRKEAVKEISKVIATFSPASSSLANSGHSDNTKNTSSTGFVAPHFAIFNKMYNEPPFQSKEMVNNFVGHLGASAEMIGTNRPGTGAHLSDDMFVWFRNLGFLEETDFVNAFAPYATDPLLRARIWRVYMLCWAAKSCQRVEGDYVDLGCYDGRTVHVISRYIDLSNIDKQYYLYDLFENPTAESRKAKHGASLHAEVQALFSQYPRVKVIKGPVPESFEQGLPEKIAFAQIDLNEANAEMAALEVIYDRVTPGGIIIFDDFGFKRYAESYNRESSFFRKRGDIVFESPTGQGLFIKRG